MRDMKRIAALAMGAMLLSACEQSPVPDDNSSVVDFALPEPVSNNAVAIAEGPDGPTIYSFNGLKAGKTWSDTSNQAFACVIAIKACEAITAVPVSEGRLASAAVTVGGKIYLFGGYTVAENGDEVSTPEVFVFDPADNSYTRTADMPVPVDDMVAAAYQDRYVYLVSGWHDEGNISAVQLYDTQSGTWSEATEFPGEAVFGHAGGIAGNSIIVTDGVAVAGLVDGKRKFAAAPFAWRGDIDPANPEQITWRGIDAHPGGPRYRMAAMGDDDSGKVIFAGGGDNPYNYDGVGYDGEPAKPTDRIFSYNLASNSWVEEGKLAAPTMDHRSLVKSGDRFYVAGGMDGDLAILDSVTSFSLKD